MFLFAEVGEVNAGGLHGGEALGDFALIADRGGENLRLGHGGGELGFDVDGLLVVFEIDLVAAVHFAFVEHLVLAEELHRLLADEGGNRVNGGLEIGQAALLSFRVPRFRVTVAVENDPFVLLDDLGKECLQRLVEVFTRFRIRFELRGDVVERLGDNRIQRGVGTRNRLAGGNRTEFKLVASEGEGGGAVTVAGIARELRQDAGAEFHKAALLGGTGRAFLKLLDDVVELVPEEDGDDGGGSFVGAEAVIVAGGGDGHAKEAGIFVD